MERIFGPLKSRFGELVASMSLRDRKLFVGLVVGAYVVVLGGLGWMARGALADVESRIASQEQTLALLNGLAADEASARTQVDRIHQQMDKYAGQDLQSFMEKAAQKVGVSSNLQGVREKQIITDGPIEERTFSVDLSKVTLQQLVEFLYEVETTGYPVKIRSMKTRGVTNAGAKVVTVSMEVSAFKLLAEPEAPAAEAVPG